MNLPAFHCSARGCGRAAQSPQCDHGPQAPFLQVVAVKMERGFVQEEPVQSLELSDHHHRHRYRHHQHLRHHHRPLVIFIVTLIIFIVTIPIINVSVIVVISPVTRRQV